MYIVISVLVLACQYRIEIFLFYSYAQYVEIEKSEFLIKCFLFFRKLLLIFQWGLSWVIKV